MMNDTYVQPIGRYRFGLLLPSPEFREEPIFLPLVAAERRSREAALRTYALLSPVACPPINRAVCMSAPASMTAVYAPSRIMSNVTSSGSPASARRRRWLRPMWVSEYWLPLALDFLGSLALAARMTGGRQRTVVTVLAAGQGCVRSPSGGLP